MEETKTHIHIVVKGHSMNVHVHTCADPVEELKVKFLPYISIASCSIESTINYSGNIIVLRTLIQPLITCARKFLVNITM